MTNRTKHCQMFNSIGSNTFASINYLVVCRKNKMYFYFVSKVWNRKMEEKRFIFMPFGNYRANTHAISFKYIETKSLCIETLEYKSKTKSPYTFLCRKIDNAWPNFPIRRVRWPHILLACHWMNLLIAQNQYINSTMHWLCQLTS